MGELQKLRDGIAARFKNASLELVAPASGTGWEALDITCGKFWIAVVWDPPNRFGISRILMGSAPYYGEGSDWICYDFGKAEELVTVLVELASRPEREP